MKTLVSFAAILLLVIAAAGCGTTSVKYKPEPPAQKIDLADSEAVKEQLYAQYREWKGTPYKFGGQSKEGIDCSGLIYITYLEKLGREVPRSTKLQARIARVIERSELRAGDLVFFRTGTKVRHVGMYIEDDNFLHVSTKQGVTISNLNDHYWKDTYRHSRRFYY